MSYLVAILFWWGQPSPAIFLNVYDHTLGSQPGLRVGVPIQMVKEVLWFDSPSSICLGANAAVALYTFNRIGLNISTNEHGYVSNMWWVRRNVPPKNVKPVP